MLVGTKGSAMGGGFAPWPRVMRASVSPLLPGLLPVIGTGRSPGPVEGLVAPHSPERRQGVPIPYVPPPTTSQRWCPPGVGTPGCRGCWGHPQTPAKQVGSCPLHPLPQGDITGEEGPGGARGGANGYSLGRGLIYPGWAGPGAGRAAIGQQHKPWQGIGSWLESWMGIG